MDAFSVMLPLVADSLDALASTETWANNTDPPKRMEKNRKKKYFMDYSTVKIEGCLEIELPFNKIIVA